LPKNFLIIEWEIQVLSKLSGAPMCVRSNLCPWSII